jgi:hypothetical protein
VRYPIHTYQNAAPNCAIVGAAFYRPQIFRFPIAYDGRYFFGDYCGGFIRMLSPPNYSSSTEFATGISILVDIQTHQDGSLYYLAAAPASSSACKPPPARRVPGRLRERARLDAHRRRELRHSRALAARRPGAHHQAGMPLQLGSCQGSANCLITGLAAGSSNGANDVDGGQTSIESPAIALPTGHAVDAVVRTILRA